jgi:hypothetical protein
MVAAPALATLGSVSWDDSVQYSPRMHALFNVEDDKAGSLSLLALSSTEARLFPLSGKTLSYYQI